MTKTNRFRVYAYRQPIHLTPCFVGQFGEFPIIDGNPTTKNPTNSKLKLYQITVREIKRKVRK